MATIITAGFLASAPGWRQLLASPHERVLWPILILVALFAIWGVWMGRAQREPRREDEDEAERPPGGNESSPN